MKIQADTLLLKIVLLNSPYLSPMISFIRYTVVFCLCFIQFAASAQEIFLDTFIRKDGIYAVPTFEQREPRTLFAVASSKKKTINAEDLLDIKGAERIRRYSTSSFGDQKKEPYSYFRVLRDLEAHDSAAYFESMTDIPAPYQTFFTGLFYLENNNFKKGLPVFENLLNSGLGDSLLVRETAFWLDITKKLIDEETEYNAILNAYAELSRPRKERYEQVIHSMDSIRMPEYRFHKYLIQYNYNYKLNDYKGAREAYDSLLAYTVNPKMKSSLTKNKTAVEELFLAKETFIKVLEKKIYHYEMDYMYDHLEIWGSQKLTDREYAEDAGFTLSKKFTTKTDTIYTRWLKDTAANGTLSKFEVLSFLRSPMQNGRRFVVVKLGFDREETYKQYDTFLQKFKAKPIQQSVFHYTSKISEGTEYMLTKYFIASLYKQEDPMIKYVLCLYLLEDAEGNPYAVDTLFD